MTKKCTIQNKNIEKIVCEMYNNIKKIEKNNLMINGRNETNETKHL